MSDDGPGCADCGEPRWRPVHVGTPVAGHPAQRTTPDHQYRAPRP